MAWMNDDGLYIKFGTEEGATGVAGEYNRNEPLHYIEVEINWDELEAFDTLTILSDHVKIPDGVFLEKASFEVVTAFVGATATISFGTLDTDRTTEHDEDGIDAQIAITAIDAIGDTITCDGALIDTVLDNTTPMLLTALVETADFTAGKGFLRVYYRHI
jgi:hypothetical protein